jgi:multiple sugar transport system substrate-binding protein
VGGRGGRQIYHSAVTGVSARLALARVMLLVTACSMTLLAACVSRADVLTFSGSALGSEGAVVRRQLERFAASHPARPVQIRVTPDAADQRHQLYVQWLNAWTPDPDVLQLDVIWTPEFAAAGWILPLDGFGQSANDTDFFSAPLRASRWLGHLYAIPWFVDVGVLYWRTDLVAAPPATFDALVAAGRDAIANHRGKDGFVWEGARYEGLVAVFLEHLAGFGGRILDDDGHVAVDTPEAIRALTFMRRSIDDFGVVPASVLTWQEEQARFAFQNGRALFMRNWPYAASLMRQPAESAVAGRFAVAAMPHDLGSSMAAPGSSAGLGGSALGGSVLAINARSRHPGAAWALVRYLTDPEQMLERARVVGQLPPRRSLYDGDRLAGLLPIAPAEARRLIDSAIPRPVTPIYTQLSGILQIHLHRALTHQEEPGSALSHAATDMRRALAAAGLPGGEW